MILLEAQNLLDTEVESHDGRPSIVELIEQENVLGVGKTSLRETIHVTAAINNFPLLRCSNEPLSHISDATIRPLIALLNDTFTETCHIPNSIANSLYAINPFTTDVRRLSLAATHIPGHDLLPNDGDGIIVLNNGSLNGAAFHRLQAIDAPELYTTYFIRAGDNVFNRRNGHISHLALHFYLRTFTGPKGTALTYLEIPSKHVENDKYNRSLSSFWLKWTNSPTAQELFILDATSSIIANEEIHVKARLMSCFNPRMATADNPFFLNLNALLVVTGFCLVFTRYVLLLESD